MKRKREVAGRSAPKRFGRGRPTILLAHHSVSCWLPAERVPSYETSPQRATCEVCRI